MAARPVRYPGRPEVDALAAGVGPERLRVPAGGGAPGSGPMPRMVRRRARRHNEGAGVEPPAGPPSRENA
ncbi:MAG: hypothetical protein PVI57_12145 [Gemmatimonadota bacterium]|jgi:hypothetical protein